MRRTLVSLGGGLVQYHEWHLHEPLLQNYDGWRILDNVPYESKFDAMKDFGGVVRHLDPIIDDPRLTHQQRVSRLYRWALKELQMWITAQNGTKFNLCYKVIRRRFEKYRYVTDPALCDMMIRETQKYLRDNCCHAYMEQNAGAPNMNLTLANPMFHPDNALSYDHWTPPEVFWYDDAKLHRYHSHHPAYAGAGEKSDRYGDGDTPRVFFYPLVGIGIVLVLLRATTMYALAYTPGQEDVRFERWARDLDIDLAAALRLEENYQRSKHQTSMINFDWERVMGGVVIQNPFGTLMPPPQL